MTDLFPWCEFYIDKEHVVLPPLDPGWHVATNVEPNAIVGWEWHSQANSGSAAFALTNNTGQDGIIWFPRVPSTTSAPIFRFRLQPDHRLFLFLDPLGTSRDKTSTRFLFSMYVQRPGIYGNEVRELWAKIEPLSIPASSP